MCYLKYNDRDNILSKKEYAYTTGDNLTEFTAKKSDSYTYYSNDGMNYQDEMAVFDGNTLTYDKVGNHTAYNGYPYT